MGPGYSTGLDKGLDQDYTTAVAWFRKAADQGYTQAQFQLGAMYETGRGVAQDYAAAVLWYRKAAGQGHPEAQIFLGRMYEKGRGVVRDYREAYKWAILAAAKASSSLRPSAIDLRDTLAERMTQEDIAIAQRLAREWKPIPSEP